jgi:hypothetical protein
MTILHIEHAITDFDTWREAFDRFDGARRDSGVRSHLIHRPVDDPRYVVVQLDFEGAEQASAFRAFLEDVVWSTNENSPGLAGTPRTMVLETVGQ